MDKSVVAAVVLVAGSVMFASSFGWQSVTASTMVHTGEAVEERAKAQRDFHAKMHQYGEAAHVAAKKKKQVATQVKDELTAAKEKQTAVLNRQKSAGWWQSAGTRLLRYGGCAFVLGGGFAFFLYKQDD